MSEPEQQRWVCTTASGHVRYQIFLPPGEEPKPRHCGGWRFAKAHKVERFGNLMIEDFDPATGGWVEDGPSCERLAKRMRREGVTLDDVLDRIEALEAEVRRLAPPNGDA